MIHTYIYIYTYVYIYIYQICVSFNIYREHIALSNPSNFTMAGQHPSAQPLRCFQLSPGEFWDGTPVQTQLFLGGRKLDFVPQIPMAKSISLIPILRLSSRHLQHFPPTSMTTFVSLGFMIHLGQSLSPRNLGPSELGPLHPYSKDFCFSRIWVHHGSSPNYIPSGKSMQK